MLLGRLPLMGKASRNVTMSATCSQEVKDKSVSTHTLEPLVVEKEVKRDRAEPLKITQVFEQHEQKMRILERDREIYDSQSRRMKHRIDSLKNQLEKAKVQATKCTSSFTPQIDNCWRT